MALWQLKIELIPTERVYGRAQIDDAEFEQADWWSNRQPPPGYRAQLASLLPPTKSWCDRLLWYGQEEKDRIDVWTEYDRVVCVGVRIDCTKENVPFIQGLLNLALDWSCSLVELRYLKVLPASLRGFVSAIAESPSNRFMEDPAHWLPKLAAEVEETDRCK